MFHFTGTAHTECVVTREINTFTNKKEAVFHSVQQLYGFVAINFAMEPSTTKQNGMQTNIIKIVIIRICVLKTQRMSSHIRIWNKIPQFLYGHVTFALESLNLHCLYEVHVDFLQIYNL